MKYKVTPIKDEKRMNGRKTDWINIFTDVSEFLFFVGNPGNPLSNRIEYEVFKVLSTVSSVAWILSFDK